MPAQNNYAVRRLFETDRLFGLHAGFRRQVPGPSRSKTPSRTKLTKTAGTRKEGRGPGGGRGRGKRSRALKGLSKKRTQKASRSKKKKKRTRASPTAWVSTQNTNTKVRRQAVRTRPGRTSARNPTHRFSSTFKRAHHSTFGSSKRHHTMMTPSKRPFAGTSGPRKVIKHHHHT